MIISTASFVYVSVTLGISLVVAGGYQLYKVTMDWVPDGSSIISRK